MPDERNIPNKTNANETIIRKLQKLLWNNSMAMREESERTQKGITTAVKDAMVENSQTMADGVKESMVESSQIIGNNVADIVGPSIAENFKAVVPIMHGGVKEGMKEASGVFGEHTSDIIGSNLMNLFSSARKIFAPIAESTKEVFKSLIPRKKEKIETTPEEERIDDNIAELTKEATTKGSIFTQDAEMKEQMEALRREMDAANLEIGDPLNITAQRSTDMVSGIDKVSFINKGMATDIELMRLAQAQQLGFWGRIMLPLRQFTARHIVKTARGTEVVANRLEEIRDILSISTGVELDSVKREDRQRRFLAKLIMSPFTLMQSTTKMMYGAITKSLFKEEEAEEQRATTYELMEQQTELLEDIVEFFGARRKAELMEEAPPKKKKEPLWMVILGATVLALGVAIGAVTRSLILPFEILGKALRGIKAIAGVLDKIGGFFAKAASLKPGKITKMMGWVTKFVGNIPLIGKFVKGLATGFKFLGWPLQIVLSLIAFVKGFMKTEGRIIDKIKGGLMKVVEDFIKFPVKLIGWIADWVLGLFDVEIKGGVGEKLLSGIMWVVERAINIILAPFRMIKAGFDLLMSVLEPVYAKSKAESGWFAKTIDFIGKVLSGIWNFVMKYTPVGWIILGIKKIWNFFTGTEAQAAVEAEGEMLDSGWFDKTISWIKNIFGKVWDFVMKYTPIGWIISGIKKLWNFFTDTKVGGDEGIFDRITNFASNVWDAAKEWLTDKLGNVPIVGRAIKALFGKSVEVGKKIVGKTVDIAKGAASKTWEWITGKGDDVVTKGGAVAKGAIKKAKDIGITVAEEVGTGAKKVVTRAKEFADIDEMKARTGRGVVAATKMRDKAMIEAQNKATLAMGKISEGQAAATNIISNIVSTGGEGAVLDEPPDEIESMGILLYNKNWGLA